jgi:hypothetical protein
VAVLPFVWGCAPQTPESTLPDPNTDLGLGDVVMLTWTTRAPEGLLGHALEPGVLRIDPHRRVVEGEARWVPNDQTLTVVVSAEETASLGAGYGPLGAKAGLGHATHVAYEVRVTGYLELPPDSLKYATASACCMGGAPSASCGEWYVVRLMRGTGKAQYLQQVSAEAGVTAVELVHAQGGTAYRRLNEMSFNDSFFAYEVVPMSALCSRVAPEEEVEVMAVRAPDNCWAQAVRGDGTRDAHAWYMPSSALCRQVAQRHCDSSEGAIGCHASFGREGETESMDLKPGEAVAITVAVPTESAPAETALAKAPPTVPEPPKTSAATVAAAPVEPKRAGTPPPSASEKAAGSASAKSFAPANGGAPANGSAPP